MSYIGKVDIDFTNYAIGTTLYGTCNTLANVADKIIELSDFDRLFPNITIYIKFIRGNNVTSNVTLRVGNTATIPVVGNCTCKFGDILAFTYEDTLNCWRIHTAGDVVSHAELNDAISSIPKSMVFRGIFDDFPDPNYSFNNYNNGDIIIVNNKKYIYNKGNSSSSTDSYWIEFTDGADYALEANQQSIKVINVWSDATVTNGVLVLPTLSTTSLNVIVPRA